MSGRGARLAALAARLSAAGLAARYHCAGGDGYLVVRRSYRRPDPEMVIDGDGCTALHYSTNLSDDPARVAAGVIDVLCAIERVAPRQSQPRAEPVARYDGSATDCAGDRAMPGPQDQIAVPERPATEIPQRDVRPPRETDAPTEARRSPGTLQERLERLPPNHPSSPHNADGSRKPPPPDLRTLATEATPGESAPNETARDSNSDLTTSDDHPETSRDSDDKGTVNPDGSWDWKGRHLTPEQSRIGEQVLETCRSAEGRDMNGQYGEHGLTPAMRRIEAQLEHGHLVPKTEEYALKSPDRFKEKLAKEIARQPDRSPDELASEIHDAIRYTFILDYESYSNGLWEAQRSLEQAGYRLDVRRNSWPNPEYKGVNSRWHDHESGLPFEIQFHTQDSWEAKQKTHHAYERIADPRTPPQEIRQLRAYQKEVSSKLEVPQGAMEIADYRREGSELV